MVLLAYTTLGRRGFEVYPYEVYTSTWVEGILEAICERWGDSDDLQNSDFWLVCTITTPNRWSNGRLTFPAERTDPLR